MELIHLIVGTEKFLIEKQVENIIKGVFGEEIEENSISKYDMLEDSINTAIEDCETIPFFSDKKIVIINNPFFLTGETPKTEVVHNLEIFENYLNNPVAQTILIIVAPYEKFDERKKITKLVKKVSKIYKIETLNDKKLFSSVKKIFTDRGYNVEDEAISLLISMVGTDFTLILEEIKKILLFKDENKDITTEDIRLLVSRTLEQNVFI